MLTDELGAAVAPTAELGHTGLKGGMPGEGWLYQEVLPRLRGLAGALIYREMAENDPMCGAVLWGLGQLLRTVKWTVQPAGPDDASVQAAEFVTQVLFEDLNAPFGDSIAEATTFLEHGYAIQEMVFKRRAGRNRVNKAASSTFSDGKIGFAKLAPRSQETIYRWIFDPTGVALGFEQFVQGRPNPRIPLAKCLHFKTQSRLSNPEGRSVLRNAYIPYLRKNALEDAEGVALKRLAGLVQMKIPMRYLTETDPINKKIGDAYKALADRIVKEQTGSVVLPSDRDDKGNALFELAFVNMQLGASGTPIHDTIQRYNRAMVTTTLADFVMLGGEKVGTNALMDGKTSMFMRATTGLLDAMAEPYNRQAIPTLWRLNGLPPETQPKLVPGAIAPADLDKLGMFLLRLSQAGYVPFPSPDGRLESTLMAAADLPSQDPGVVE